MKRCPICKRCPFANGVCEDRANRSRRYFLMGALALPVAAKIESVAPKIVAPKEHTVTFHFRGPFDDEHIITARATFGWTLDGGDSSAFLVAAR